MSTTTVQFSMPNNNDPLSRLIESIKTNDALYNALYDYMAYGGVPVEQITLNIKSNGGRNAVTISSIEVLTKD